MVLTVPLDHGPRGELDVGHAIDADLGVTQPVSLGALNLTAPGKSHERESSTTDSQDFHGVLKDVVVGFCCHAPTGRLLTYAARARAAVL